MSTLKFEPTDFAGFADGHRQVAGQINSALAADAPAVAAMSGAYGTVGAVFTAALNGFEATLTKTGVALASDYRQMSEALNLAAAAYARADEAGEAAITGAGGSVSA